LAAQLHIDASTVAHYELGTRAIPPVRLAECARLLNDPGLVSVPRAATSEERRTRRTSSTAKDYSEELYRWWLSRAAGLARTHGLTWRDTEAAFEWVAGYVKLSRRLILDGDSAEMPELVRELAEESLPLLEASLRHRRTRRPIATS